jgi:hypothetical protein
MQNNWVDPKWEEEQVLRIAFTATPAQRMQWLEEMMAWVNSVENVQKYKELFLDDREP